MAGSVSPSVLVKLAFVCELWRERSMQILGPRFRLERYAKKRMILLVDDAKPVFPVNAARTLQDAVSPERR